MSLYDGAKTRVRVGSAYSEEFKVKVGVHQGSVLSPLLFAIVVDIGAEFVILPGMCKVYDVKIETLPFDYVRYSEDEEINYILTTNHYIRCNPKFDSQMYKFFVTIVHMRAHLQVQSAIYHKIVA